jgi:hypothetical protein
LHDQLRAAQALLRHQVPDGDVATVLGRALTLLVADLERKKAAVTDRPRPSRAGAGAAPPASGERGAPRGLAT